MSTPHSFEPGANGPPNWLNCRLRRSQAAAMGGPEALAKFKASGRLNARERIAALLMTAASVNWAAWPARATTAATAASSASTRPTPSSAPAASRAQGGAARGRLHHPRRLVRGHHRRQVDLHRAPGAPVAHAAGPPGGFGRRQRQAADADRRHQDPRVPELAGQRAAEDRAGGRRGAGRLRRAGRDQGAVVALFGDGARAGAGDGGRAPCGAAGLWPVVDKNALGGHGCTARARWCTTRRWTRPTRWPRCSAS
jgi:hypothetical protein